MAGIIDSLTRKQLKPKGFRYKPIYYNAEKEAFRLRVERLKAEVEAEENGEIPRKEFKGRFRSQVGKKSQFQRSIAIYNLRLMALLLAVSIGAYYLYSTGHIHSAVNQFFEVFSKKDGLY